MTPISQMSFVRLSVSLWKIENYNIGQFYVMKICTLFLLLHINSSTEPFVFIVFGIIVTVITMLLMNHNLRMLRTSDIIVDHYCDC